jgi:hypothetical protein
LSHREFYNAVSCKEGQTPTDCETGHRRTYSTLEWKISSPQGDARICKKEHPGHFLIQYHNLAFIELYEKECNKYSDMMYKVQRKKKKHLEGPGLQSPRLYTTCARVWTISGYNSLDVQPFGDEAAECTTIKLQKGPFYHNPHLGFSTIKLS